MRQPACVTSKQGDAYGNVNYNTENVQGMFTFETYNQGQYDEQCIESESDFTFNCDQAALSVDAGYHSNQSVSFCGTAMKSASNTASMHIHNVPNIDNSGMADRSSDYSVLNI